MDDIQAGRRKRLYEFKNTLKINNIKFSKALKTNPGFVSQLLNGHRNITEAFAYQVSKCYPGFNPDWLITGNGDMYSEKKSPEPGILTGVMESEAPEYQRDRALRVEDLPEVILNLQATVEDLLARVNALEDMVRQIVTTYKKIEPPKK